MGRSISCFTRSRNYTKQFRIIWVYFCFFHIYLAFLKADKMGDAQFPTRFITKKQNGLNAKASKLFCFYESSD